MQAIAETSIEAEGAASFGEQIESLYEVVEQLEDAVAQAMKREKGWEKERQQLLDIQAKLEKKLGSADEDVKFIKEHLDQSKKQKEQGLAGAKKEREQMQAEIKRLRERNKQLGRHVEKVTTKLDAAISKIGALMEE